MRERRFGRDSSSSAAARQLTDDPRRDAALEATRAARDSYGKLLSILASRTRDIAPVEDAPAEAFAAALAQWPEHGAPSNPLVWLLTVARRNSGHTIRHRQTAERGADLVRLSADERADMTTDGYCDERLKLMLVCAHPAIAPDAQTSLMLQTVLGLDAARIAASFLVSSASMGQRLVRGKRRVRYAGIAFAVPDPGEIPQRLSTVSSAIYAALWRRVG